MTMIHKTNIPGYCPGGFCDYIQHYSVPLIVALCIDIFIFFVTLVPPLFDWSTKKPDGKKRIYFAALACITFYFWLIFLAVNTLYCFSFLAHGGPCVDHVPFATTPRPNDTVLIATEININDIPILSSSPESNPEPQSDGPRKASRTKREDFRPISFTGISEISKKSKRHGESSLESPTIVPQLSPAFSSSSFSYIPGSFSSSSLNPKSFSSPPLNSPNIYTIRDSVAKAHANSTRLRSSLRTLLAFPQHSLSSSLSSPSSTLTSSQTPNFSQTYLETPSGNKDGPSSYPILAQALKSGSGSQPAEGTNIGEGGGSEGDEDCITSTADEEEEELSEHETNLRNVFFINVLILVVLLVVLVANAKEGKKSSFLVCLF